MEETAEKNNAPLKDSEISRLIEISKDAGYKKQELIPTRNLIDFKPKSIMEIAFKENPGEDIETKDSEGPLEGEAEESDVEKEVQTTAPEDFLEKKPSVETALPEEQPSEAISESVLGSADADIQGADETPKEPIEKEIDTETSSESLGSSENKKEIDPVNSAKQEGIEIGRKMAASESENTFGEATKTLLNVIESLKGKDAVDKSDLMQSILTTITNIASERAGQIIDDHPKSFEEKLKTFIDEIDKSSKKVILNLNPHDAKLVGSNILKNFTGDDLQIKENSDLFRGDSILQLGSIEIGDIISERITFETETDGKEDTNLEIAKEDLKSNNVSGKEDEKKSSEKKG